MFIEGTPQLPHNSKKAWIRLFNQPAFVPDLVQKRVLHRKKQIAELAEWVETDESDTYIRALSNRYESHIIFISQEFMCSEQIKAKAPRVFQTEVPGSGLNREDVVMMMEEAKYQEYEDLVEQQLEHRGGRRDRVTIKP